MLTWFAVNSEDYES